MARWTTAGVRVRLTGASDLIDQHLGEVRFRALLAQVGHRVRSEKCHLPGYGPLDHGWGKSEAHRRVRSDRPAPRRGPLSCVAGPSRTSREVRKVPLAWVWPVGPRLG